MSYMTDIFFSRQSGDGARHLEDAPEGTGRQPQSVGDHPRQFLTRIIDGAELAGMTRFHAGVGRQFEGRKLRGLEAVRCTR